MKKLIAIILVAVMCLSLVACGGGSQDAEKAIVGEWKALSGFSMTFNEDGTGIAPFGGDFEWRYDAEKDWYDVSCMGMSFSMIIKTENDIRYINVEGENYYHADDYEKAVEANK